MTTTESADAWLSRTLQRLESDGFAISRDVLFGNHQFKAAAHRSQFEVSKLGNTETFFVFGDLPAANSTSIREFSAQAFSYAVKSKGSFLPRGLFESVFCFPVGITSALDANSADWLRNTPPARHWSSGEIAVVYDQGAGSICFFEKTPIWGAMYYSGFRGLIEQYLAPTRPIT